MNKMWYWIIGGVVLLLIIAGGITYAVTKKSSGRSVQFDVSTKKH